MNKSTIKHDRILVTPEQYLFKYHVALRIIKILKITNAIAVNKPEEKMKHLTSHHSNYIVTPFNS